MKLEIKKYSVEILLAVAVIGLAFQIVDAAAKPADLETAVPLSTQLSTDENKQTPVTPVSNANDPANLGKMLYLNHCMICHESNAHIRAKRQARSREDIATWVTRWASYLELKWSDAYVEAVTEYIDETYYQFENK